MLYVLIFIIALVVVVVLQPVKVPVLTYHDFSDEKTEDSMQIDVETFEEEMKFLANHHYHSLTLEEMECFIKNKCSIPKKSVLITMDDGWMNEYKIAAPILKKYNLNAVIFYVGEHLDDDNPNFMHRDEVEALQKDYPNIELASHSYSLHFEDAYKLTKEEFVQDMDLMKDEVLETSYYAYPYGRSSDAYREALKEEKFKLAFTFGPDQEHRKATQEDSIYQVPRLNMSGGMPYWKFILRLNWYK